MENNDVHDNKAQKELHIDHVFCEVLAYCHDTNIWGPGPILHAKSGPACGRANSPADVQDESTFTSLSSKTELNTDVLFSVSIGNTRLMDYYKEFAQSDLWNETTRSEK
jgi:hypothetical protein